MPRSGCWEAPAFWQYQIVATLFAAGTAWTIARLARPAAGPFGGIAAGLAYLAWIETVEGGGGQAPVFYNLLAALAAERVLAAGACRDGATFQRQGRWAMALVGLGIQIKYTMLCEGLYFGLVLAWWSGRRLAFRSAVPHVASLVALALAPTVAAALFYAAIGEWHAFAFANFISIFQRAPSDPAAVRTRLGQIALQFLPFLICAIASLWELRRDDRGARDRNRFLLGWMGSALVGFVSVGAFYFHYALPLFVPAAVLAAPIFRRRPIGPVLAALLLWLPLSHLDFPDFTTTIAHRRAVTELTRLIPADVDRRCLQLFDGPPILYLATHACLASRYPFPDHLIAAKEAHSLGIDRQAEVGRIFARRPGAIVIGERSYAPDRAIDRLLRAMLARDYRLAGSTILDDRVIEVFVPR